MSDEHVSRGPSYKRPQFPPNALYQGRPCPLCHVPIRALVRVGPYLVIDPCAHQLMRMPWLDANGDRIISRPYGT